MKNTKHKITAYIFFGLFLCMGYYFCSLEDMKESALTGALILGLI